MKIATITLLHGSPPSRASTSNVTSSPRKNNKFCNGSETLSLWVGKNQVCRQEGPKHFERWWSWAVPDRDNARNSPPFGKWWTEREMHAMVIVAAAAEPKPSVGLGGDGARFLRNTQRLHVGKPTERETQATWYRQISFFRGNALPEKHDRSWRNHTSW